MSFLLDTDICSAHLKRPAGLTSRFVQYSGRLAVSVLTIGELLTWARRRGAPARRLEGIEALSSEVDSLVVSEKVAEVFGELRAGQLDAGTPTPTADLWIAATAVAHGLTLVTHNTRDYQNIPGLVLVDWLVD